MGSFLTQNKKKFGLTISQESIYGDIVRSVSRESVVALTRCLYNFLTENSYLRLHVAHNGSKWASLVLKSIVIPEVENLGLRCAVISKPSPPFQLGWVNRQSRLKSLGLYLGSAGVDDETLCFYIVDEHGKSVVGKNLLRILRYSSTVSVVVAGDLEGLTEYIDTSLYINYMFDSGYIHSKVPTGQMRVDAMFGAASPLLDSLKEKLPGLSIYNSSNEPFRLINYSKAPTGDALKWHTKKAAQLPQTNYCFFCIGNDGDSIGLFDLYQGVEISSSGVCMLLLYYLHKYKNVTGGNVLISRGLSKRVTKYSRKLGLKPKIIHNYSFDLSNSGDSVRLYGDERGCFWLLDDVRKCNAMVALFSVVNMCELEGRSPGQILDEIHKSLKCEYPYYNIFFSNEIVSQDRIEEVLDRRGDLIKRRFGGIVEYASKDTTRLVISNNDKFKLVEVYAESKKKEALIGVIDYITKNM